MKVIKNSNLPTKLPVTITVVFVLWLKTIGMQEWLMGIISFLLLVVWVFAILRLCEQKETDIFKDK